MFLTPMMTPRASPACAPPRNAPVWRHSQGGAKLPTGGNGASPRSPRAAPVLRGVSRPGAIPGPTVIVRMEESDRIGAMRPCLLSFDALGDVSNVKGDPDMTLPRYAFIKANWHSDIVDRALDGFAERRECLVFVTHQRVAACGVVEISH